MFCQTRKIVMLRNIRLLYRIFAPFGYIIPGFSPIRSRPSGTSGEVWHLIEILRSQMWGADAAVPSGGLKTSDGLKNAYWAFVACGAAGSGARRLRPRPEGRFRLRRGAWSEGRCRPSGSAGSGRASWSGGTQGRARPAQSQHSGHSVGLPQWELLGFVSRRRGSCERLLWAGAKSRHVSRRTTSIMRHRGQRRQRSADRGVRHGATITEAGFRSARAELNTA
jgi:hypothetical protein